MGRESAGRRRDSIQRENVRASGPAASNPRARARSSALAAVRRGAVVDVHPHAGIVRGRHAAARRASSHELADMARQGVHGHRVPSARPAVETARGVARGRGARVRSRRSRHHGHDGSQESQRCQTRSPSHVRNVLRAEPPARPLSTSPRKNVRSTITRVAARCRLRSLDQCECRLPVSLRFRSWPTRG